MSPAKVLDLGSMSYESALQEQVRTLEGVLNGEPGTLLFVEHDPVLTLGANFHSENLLLTEDEYWERGISVVKTDRGGDVTFHCPGQLVIYPIFSTELVGRDLHRWLRGLEETMIRTCEAFHLQARRFPPNTGAWVGEKKIAAIGIKVRRWVSMHGIALNCDNDLDPFSWIVPCGIQEFGVTSLTQETGRRISTDEAKGVVQQAFAEVFDLKF